MIGAIFNIQRMHEETAKAMDREGSSALEAQWTESARCELADAGLSTPHATGLRSQAKKPKGGFKFTN